MSSVIRSIYCSLRGIPVLGIPGAAKFLTTSLIKRTVTITPKSYKQPLIVRGDTSDVETFFQIIIRESYPSSRKKVETIVDAGANVGYSAAFFAKAYPQAKVYALEPEPQNYDLLVKNTSSLSNVVPLNCALWKSSGELYLQNTSAESYAFQFGDSPTTEVKVDSFSIPDLMNSFAIKNIDILKIDIEGAEKELFSGNTDWVDQVETIYVEVHDRIVEGAAAQIFRVMSGYKYDFDVRFEYVVFDNIKRLKTITSINLD